MDAHTNLAYSTVAAAPSPALSGTTLTVATGQGTRFPATPFNAIIWPISDIPNPANAEIVRVTNITGDVLTFTRTQEGTSARAVIVGDQIGAAATAKTFTDIESVLATAVKSGDAAGGDLTGTYPNPTVAAAAIGNTKLRNSSALSVIGRSANSSGSPADITAGTNGHVLKRVNGTLAFASPGMFNVIDYGAVGDGSTDDTTAIQAAINAATGGGIVYFPPTANFYQVTSTLTVTVAGVTLQGAGPGASIIKFNSRTTFAVSVAADKFTCRDLELYYNNASAATNGGAILLSSGGQALIDRCVIDGGFYDNINVVNAYNFQVTRNNSLKAVRAHMFCDSVTIPDRGDSEVGPLNTFDYSGTQASSGLFYWQAGGAIRVFNNKFLGGVYGINCALTAGITTSGPYISNNSLEQQTTAAIRLYATTGTCGLAQVLNNEIAVQSADAIIIDGSPWSNVAVVGNTVAPNAASVGIKIQNNVASGHVSDNLICGATTGISQTSGSALRIERTNVFTSCTTDVSDSGSFAGYRTGRISFRPYGIADSTDGHGSLNAVSQTLHFHMADGVTSFLFLPNFEIPNDDAQLAAADWVVKWMWSSEAANNNATFQLVFSTHVDAATANVDVLNNKSNYAAANAANKMKVSSIALSSLPAAGSIISGYLARVGGDAGDTNTGTVSVWQVWVEYKGRLY